MVFVGVRDQITPHSAEATSDTTWTDSQMVDNIAIESYCLCTCARIFSDQVQGQRTVRQARFELGDAGMTAA